MTASFCSSNAICICCAFVRVRIVGACGERDGERGINLDEGIFGCGETRKGDQITYHDSPLTEKRPTMKKKRTRARRRASWHWGEDLSCCRRPPLHPAPDRRQRGRTPEIGSVRAVHALADAL